MKKNQKMIKNLVSANSIPQPQPRANEIKIQKKTINDSSSHSFSNIPSNKQLENNFKDSLEGSISESKTNLLIPDSLNNTKSSIGNINNKKNNKRKNINEADINKDNNNKNENGEKESIWYNNNEESTKKIDYRFYTNYPIVIINNIYKSKKKENNKYWFAAYDKLIKRKKILKILNYYDKGRKNNENNLNIDLYQEKRESIKEQLLIIKDFDIYFMKEENKPFIKYIKGNCIFTKLYLLTLEEINLILNYINRYKLSITSSNINSLQKKGNFQKLNENYKNFPYNMIYHMGFYMNINIYGFSNFYLQENNMISYNYLNQKFPSSKKIAKLVKLLMIHFPKYSFNFFVCYLLSKIRFENFNEKTNEIKNIVYAGDSSFFPLNHGYLNEKLLNNSIIHSSYSPLSHYEENTSNEKPIFKQFTKNNYQDTIDKNMIFEYHTIDNCNSKITLHKNNNNIINNNRNKTVRNDNDNYKKRILRRHTESVYLNGYLGKEYKLNFRKIKEKEKNINGKKHINKHIITNIRPSLLINNDHMKSNMNINRNKIDKSSNNTTIKNKSFCQNNKINFPNYVQVKKKNTNYIEKGILKQKELFSVNYETEHKHKHREIKILDEKNEKSKSNINHLTSKIIINTKSEETKIGTINKEMTNYINNSCKEDINKENTGIFVVSKRMATDIHDGFDDDSSSMISNKYLNGQSSIYMTPEKKKKYRYYS